MNSNGTVFGWKTIVDMYRRECKRRDSGYARMIPKLHETHILRDSWTKLNVIPAKIMQVRSSKNVYNQSLLCIAYVFTARIGTI